MAIAKDCKGCKSAPRHYGVTYSACRYYIGEYDYENQIDIFRDKYCPCVDCIVKVTCTDPKVNRHGEDIKTKMLGDHKCHILNDKIAQFKQEHHVYS